MNFKDDFFKDGSNVSLSLGGESFRKENEGVNNGFGDDFLLNDPDDNEN